MTAEHSFRPGYAVAPGETLAELIEERAMTQTEVARRLGISLKHANQVVRGSASISAELALGLEKVFDIPAGFWLSRESFYRAALARQSETQDLSKWVEWAKRFPLRELKKRGQIAKEAQGAAVVEELLRFLGVASPELWQEPAAAYRRSRRFKSDPYALAAWLRVAELEANEIDCAPFDGERLLETLRDLPALTQLAPREWHPRLVELCAAAGVAVVVLDTFDGARANGATRWLTPRKALVQLSLRYRWEDIFWFTFFHEAAHVLLHRKKDFFLEGLPPSKDAEDATWIALEEEADRFAMRLLIPEEHERELAGLSLAEIPGFAGRLRIAPAIVVGRMQHEGLLPFNRGNDYRRRLAFVD